MLQKEKKKKERKKESALHGRNQGCWLKVRKREAKN
jgi:hypothetical protein